MIRGYLVATSMLVLGLAGVVVIAAQASQSPAPKQRGSQAGAAAETGDPKTMERPGPARVPAMRPPARPVMATVPVVMATAPAADAGAPMATPLKPDASAPRVAPRPPAEPAPDAVLAFSVGYSKPGKKHRRTIRKLVNKHGYKDVVYHLTPYAAEKRRPKHNRSLAKRRCRKVARLIRKRGVSRRWIKCETPRYRKEKGAPSDTHKSPAWRRVVIRVEKK